MNKNICTKCEYAAERIKRRYKYCVRDCVSIRSYCLDSFRCWKWRERQNNRGKDGTLALSMFSFLLPRFVCYVHFNWNFKFEGPRAGGGKFPFDCHILYSQKMVITLYKWTNSSFSWRNRMIWGSSSKIFFLKTIFLICELVFRIIFLI